MKGSEVILLQPRIELFKTLTLVYDTSYPDIGPGEL